MGKPDSFYRKQKVKSQFILVGGAPSKLLDQNPGGQLTASIGLSQYAKSAGYNLDIIDTTQSSFPVPPFTKRLFKGLQRIKALRGKLSKEKIDGLIVFSCTGFSFYERTLMCLIARFYDVKSLFFLRDGYFLKSVKNSLFTFHITKLFLKLPSIIGAQGNNWVDIFKSLDVPEEKIVTVRNWLSLDFPVSTKVKSASKLNRLRFVFVGWLVTDKGVTELLQAANQLLNDYDFELIFVGDGTLKNEIEKDIKDNSNESNIFITGWQSHQDVLKYLSTSHVFILPSKAEGFPNALLEALALGLPAICTNVGAISDSLHHGVNGFLLLDGTTESIKLAMKKYLQQPELIEMQSAESLKIFHSQHNREENCKRLFDQFI